MGSEIYLDTLPYIDQGYEEAGVREAAMQLVEEETRRYRPSKNYLEFLQPPKTTFETPLLKTEFERVASRRPMEMLSMKRYELPQPGAAQKNDVAAWQDSVDNSMAQLEHQAGRIINLELLSQYSSNEYRLHNTYDFGPKPIQSQCAVTTAYVLSHMVDHGQKQLKSLRNKIQEVNWQRKTEQTAAGGQLTALSNHWNTLVHKNFEIERVCVELEEELKSLKEQARMRGMRVDSEDV